MKYMLQLLTLICCRSIQGVLEWTVIGKVTNYGQNVTLFCNVPNCCSKDAGWERYSPEQRTLFIDLKTAQPNKKYDGKVLSNGYTLIIQNLTKQDLNVSYSCLYGVTFGESKFLLEDDVFTYEMQPSIPVGNSRLTGDKIVGIIFEVLVPVVVAVVFIVTILWRRKQNKSRRQSNRTRTNYDRGADDKEPYTGDNEFERCTGEDKVEPLLVEDAYEEGPFTDADDKKPCTGEDEVEPLLDKISTDEDKSLIDWMSMGEKETYKAAIQDGEEDRQHVRIQVIGKNGVGKTSLVRTLLGKEFIENLKSTDGIDIVRECQIRTTDGKWIIGEGKTKSARIRRIIQAVKMPQKDEQEKELVSDQPHAFDDYSAETHRTEPAQKPNQSDKKAFETESVDEIFDIKDNSISTAPKSDSYGDEADLNDTKQSMESPDSSVQSPVNVNTAITDQTTKQIIETVAANMNEIIERAKREKENTTSENLVDCDFWDFAGQKEYYATHQTFCSQHSIYLIVADINEEIKDTELDKHFNHIGDYIGFWLDSIHCLCKDLKHIRAENLYPPVIMVFTGIDKVTDKEIAKRKAECKNKFHAIFGQNKKANHTRSIRFISNKNPREKDIDCLKNDITQIAKDLKYFVEKRPTKWINLETALEVMRGLENKVPVFSFDDIHKLADKNSIYGNELLLFLNYQHKIGNIIFFDDIQKYIILQPNWLVSCFKCLICDEEKLDTSVVTEMFNLKHGAQLTDTLIDGLFQKVPDLKFRSYKEHILNVMEKFDIIVKPQFENSDCESYYMPCMIENSDITLNYIMEDLHVQDDNRTPWLVFEFSFLPIAYYNHILVSYIKKYTVCTLRDNSPALYEGKAVVYLGEDQTTRLVICFSRNAVSLQLWKRQTLADSIYQTIIRELDDKVNEFKRMYSNNILYEIKAKCNTGDYSTISDRKTYDNIKKICEKGTYHCLEHRVDHSKTDIESTWFKYPFKSYEAIPESIPVTVSISIPQTVDTKANGDSPQSIPVTESISIPQTVDPKEPESMLSSLSLINRDDFKDLVALGTFASYDYKVHLAGTCNSGKSSLASILIGDVIPKTWISTKGLVIHFGKNGIDLKHRKMVPLKKESGKCDVLTRVLLGNPKLKEQQRLLCASPTKTNADQNKDNTFPISNLEKNENKLNPTHTSNSIQDEILERLKKGYDPKNIAPTDLVDFGGQTSLDMTHQLLIQHRGTFVLMFDGRIGLHEKLEEYPQGDVTAACVLHGWINSILTYCTKSEDNMPRIMFAATHSDSFTKDQTKKCSVLYQKELTKMFSTHKLHEHIMYDRVFFINATDAANIEIDCLKDKLVDIAFQQSTWGQQMPIAWVPLDLQISDMRSDGVKLITKERLLQINKSNNEFALNERRVNDFLIVHHSFGKVLYVDEPALRDFIVIQPSAMVNILRAFITDKMFWPVKGPIRDILENLSASGVLKKTDLFTLWSQPDFNDILTNAKTKEYMVQVLLHLDILVEPISYTQKYTGAHLFLVPCIVKSKIPPNIQTNVTDDRTICIAYHLRETVVPSALYFKLIGALISIWPLKVVNSRYCLYYQAAIMDADNRNELRIHVEGRRVVVCLINKDSKHFISPDLATTIQECLTLALGRILQFYRRCFSKQSRNVMIDLFEIEVGEICNGDTCLIPLSDAKTKTHWKCKNKKIHKTKCPLNWVFEKNKSYCDTNCTGPGTELLLLKPNDHNLVHLARQIGIGDFHSFFLELGMTPAECDNLNFRYFSNPMELMLMGLFEWRDKAESDQSSATFGKLLEALKAIEMQHYLCQVHSEDHSLVEKAHMRLQYVVSDDVINALTEKNLIGDCAVHLGVELELSITDIRNTLHNFPRDLVGQIHDLLIKWKNSSRRKPTIYWLMVALKRIKSAAGLKFMVKTYGVE